MKPMFLEIEGGRLINLNHVHVDGVADINSEVTIRLSDGTTLRSKILYGFFKDPKVRKALIINL